jgi:hypothetical protein
MRARDVAMAGGLAAQVAVAGFVLGVPNVAAAFDFLNGGYPTGETVTAACVLMLWIVLAGIVIVEGIRVLRRVVRHLASERVRVGALVVLGAVILAGGALRHARPVYSICCGSVTEAQQAAESGP